MHSWHAIMTLYASNKALWLDFADHLALWQNRSEPRLHAAQHAVATWPTI